MTRQSGVLFPVVSALAAVAAVIGVAAFVPGIQFGTIGFLAGLAAALLPLAIHLVGRRHARPHQFAAMTFLIRGERRIARHVRLRHLVLLALRTLASALIPLVLAHPFAPADHTALPPQMADTSTVVIIDASFSMQFTLDDRSLWARALEKVRNMVTRREPSEDFGIVITRRKATRLTPTLIADSAVLEKLVDETLAPTFESGDIVGALSEAEAILEQSERPRRRIVLMSDFAGPEFARIASWRPSDPRTTFHPIDVSQGKPLPNRAIVGVVTHPAFEVAPNTFRASVAVANFSVDAIRALPLALKVGTIELTGTIDIEPGGRATKDFHVEYAAGHLVPASASLVPPPSLTEGLKLDDSFPFVLSTRAGPNVLVVNGSPSTIPHRDEVFYLTRALNAATTERGPFQVTIVGVDEPFSPSSFDVVFLCNVGSLTDARARDIEAAVRSGTGLFVSLGSNVTAAALQRGLERLLPATPHTQQSRTAAAPFTIVPSADRSPMARAFQETALAGAGRAAFFRTFLLLPKGGDAITSLRFDDGTPALVEGPLGKGRVVVLASTIDRDWNDLPIRPVFAPWISDVAAALTLEGRAQRRPLTHVGQPLALAPGFNGTVTDPTGKSETRTVGDPRPVVATRPGLYRIHTTSAQRGAGPTEHSIPVNLDAAESDTRKSAAHSGAVSVSATGLAGASAPGGAPLATHFALALLLALLIESLVTARR